MTADVQTATPAFLRGGGRMGDRMRDFDWATTPMGPPDRWPRELRSAVNLMLHSSFPTAIYWGPELRLLYNDSWSVFLAEREPRALGAPGSEVWTELWSVLAPQFAQVFATGEGFAAHNQMLLMKRDGALQETYWTYGFTPVSDPSGMVLGVLSQASDTTRQVHAERELAESDAKFRGITNSIDQMIWSTLPDGFHDFYNDRWYEFTGAPKGSTDGEGWNDMFHPEDQDRAWATWRRSLETGETYHIEYRLRHRSGVYRWVLGRAQPVRGADGAITRWFGTCTDIQEIVQAREVLARSRAELEREVAERTAERDRMWRNARDIQMVIDTDGVFQAVSPAWTRVLGHEPEEVVGRHYSDFVISDDRGGDAGRNRGGRRQATT